MSNPSKPKRLQDKWAEGVLAEFFEQGDKEAALGLPISPGFDRRTTTLEMSQINFSEFIVGPLWNAIVQIFPELSHAAEFVRGNYDEYMTEVLRGTEGDEASLAKGEAEQRAQLKKRRLVRAAPHRSTLRSVRSRREALRSLELPVSVFFFLCLCTA